jgi:phosphoribosylformimino-5-aminoimidazole carboxamide ribotide isomerase
MCAIRAAQPDLKLQASGGVSALADLAALKSAGASAAIVGRALYEKRFTLEDALAL